MSSSDSATPFPSSRPARAVNPLLDARDLRLPRIADPCVLVMFGITGDLARHKLLPAIYDLANRGLLSPSFSLVGVGRRSWSDDDLRAYVEKSAREGARTPWRPAIWEQLAAGMRFVEFASFEDDAAYDRLTAVVDDLDATRGTRGNRAFYLSIPPGWFPAVTERIARSGLVEESADAWRRVVIEKPFGYDLQSARELNEIYRKSFHEHQLYRIDHFLGKETVQDIMALRFANGIFEPLWNRNYIERVEITAVENMGIESRGGFYDQTGALRDMVQNHLAQLVALTAMEPPVQFNADLFRNEVVKVYQSFRPMTPEEIRRRVVRGQYTESEWKGEHQRAYREEDKIASDSRTETFVAMKLYIDNWRWSGVPFYIRTGKYLPMRFTEVVIHFKTTPHPVFNQHAPENKLSIRIQPDEGIAMRFGLKRPGAGFDAEEVSMDFRYADLAANNVLTAYERLLLDAMKGDATLFARTDAVHACWKFVEPILAYKANRGQLYNYDPGSWGPTEADKMIARSGRVWRQPK